MIVTAITGLASLILFGAAIWLIVGSRVVPPSAIRTESRRSRAEYDFRRQCAEKRRKGYVCLLVAGMSMGLCLTMGVMQMFAGTE
jgi:hypothetical protein